jgi:hypothetical protein
MAIVVTVLGVLVVGTGVLMVRIGLFKAIIELWQMPRRK